jgi:glycosyltransferase involved in cell wall biosynthesis
MPLHDPSMKPLRLLHVHSTFTLGGKEARAVRLMNAWGAAASHVVLSGMPGALAARDAIDPGIAVAFPDDHPPLTGSPSPRRYREIASYMRGFDLVLTYNWGSMDAVMARRSFARPLSLPPLIHHEDGFNEDEKDRQKGSRVLFRRLALPAAAALVVPSERLEKIARDVWRQPAARVHRIANGIPLDRYAEPPRRNAIPGFMRRPGEVVVGTVAGLRAIKNLPLLVRAFARAPGAGRLVIVGEGPEREAILAAAAAASVADRVVLAGFLPDPASYIGLFDIFALSSDSEQFPISLIEAMAAGLPAVATQVGDVAAMVAESNRPFLAPAGDEDALAGAIRRLAADAELRHAIGTANAARARIAFDEHGMIEAYRALYWDVAGAAGN